MQNRSQLVRHGVIAAIVGSACGTLAAVWSVNRHPAVRTPAVESATAVLSSSWTPPRPKAAEPVGVRRGPQSAPPAAARVSTRSAPNAPVAASGPAVAADVHDVLERARALAQRPDVMALVALRDNVVLRAAERGEQDSPATKRQLDELDRYLAEARALRLKIDAQAFRKPAPASNPDR